MARAEIISVGTELLLGQILNTNAKFISEELANLGINTYYQTTVGDNKLRIHHVIQNATKRADILIFTGGIGPTDDDLTKDSIATFIKLPLVLHKESMHRIECFFKERSLYMPLNNIRQAQVFEQGVIFPNDNGLAVGCAAEREGVRYIVLPGPPKECEHMFKTYVVPYLLTFQPQRTKIYSKILRFFGISESQLEEDIYDLIREQTDPTIAPLAGNGEITLRLTTRSASLTEANKKFEILEQKILERLGTYFYGYDDDKLIGILVDQLKQKGYTISSAESFTGGGFLEKMTLIPGTSDIVKGGMVTYSNEMKIKLLGVNPETIQQFGAISEECAIEMAHCIQRKTNSNVGVSFTGVAGPEQSEGKSVGTVMIGYKINDTTYVQSLKLFGDREMVRERAILHAANFILRKI